MRQCLYEIPNKQSVQEDDSDYDQRALTNDTRNNRQRKTNQRVRKTRQTRNCGTELTYDGNSTRLQ